MGLSIGRSSYVFLLLLLLTSFRKVEGDGSDGAELFKRWDVSDPTAMICREGVKDDNVALDSNSTSDCNNPTSAIRLEYTLHKLAKYAKYQIFHKEDCEEEFDIGTEPVQGTVISLSPESNGEDDTATASVEFFPVIVSSSSWSSWWRSLTEKKQTVEFCIRVGLWTSPKSDAMEVNFRETIVSVTYYNSKDNYNKTKKNGRDVSSSDDTTVQRKEYVIERVSVTPKPLRSVTVNVMGSSSGTIEKTENDEL
ncbi:MAG: hypothetical protein ACI8RD_008759 [Bacillariaceae sp.]|jgi:hypothetical protein